MKTLLLIALLLAFIGFLTSTLYFFNLVKDQKVLNSEKSKVKMN